MQYQQDIQNFLNAYEQLGETRKIFYDAFYQILKLHNDFLHTKEPALLELYELVLTQEEKQRLDIWFQDFTQPQAFLKIMDEIDNVFTAEQERYFNTLNDFINFIKNILMKDKK